MAVEFQILDWIQNIRTPAGDIFMSLVTKLGSAGILWIVTAVVLAVIPRTRKAGIMMMAALLLEVKMVVVVISAYRPDEVLR